MKKDIDKVEVEIDSTESVVVTENEQPIQSIVEQYKYPINGNWRAGDSKIFELKIPLLKQVTKQNILNTIGRYFQRFLGSNIIHSYNASGEAGSINRAKRYANLIDLF